MKNDGTIQADVRFQLQYPTPWASVAGTFVPDDLPKVAPSYEQTLFADLDTALERLPHERLAVQDVAVEFGALEGAMGPKLAIDEIAPWRVRCIERVRPRSSRWTCISVTAIAVTSTSSSLSRCRCRSTSSIAVSAGAGRPLSFVSFTVPQARNDNAYFEPLGGLRSGSDTELDFALVPYHPDDQTPGTTAEQIEHIDAALVNSPGGARHCLRRCRSHARSPPALDVGEIVSPPTRDQWRST